MKKTKWTDADFPEMSWHDCRIHSIGWDQDGEYQNDLVFDIDYILEWISDSENAYRFRVAPAILRFANVDNLKMDIALKFKNPLQIASVDRQDLPTKGYKNFHWTIKIQNYPGLNPNTIEFDATGFTQELTGNPLETTGQCLTKAQRKYCKIV